MLKNLLFSLLLSLAVWFFVIVKNKVPFQVEVHVKAPKGVKVFPSKVLVVGKISEKFYTPEVLNCFKTVLLEANGKYLVRVKPPLPVPFVEIESVYPQTVEVER